MKIEKPPVQYDLLKSKETVEQEAEIKKDEENIKDALTERYGTNKEKEERKSTEKFIKRFKDKMGWRDKKDDELF